MSSWICPICKRVAMEQNENGTCTSPGCKAYAKKKEDEASNPKVKKEKKVRKSRKKKE